MKFLLPPFLFLICLILVAALHHIVPILTLVSYPINLIGVVLFVFGLGLTIVGNRKFFKVGTNIMTFDKPDILVT